MVALVLVAVVIVSTAVFNGTGAPLKPFEADGMPPLPENVATYDTIDADSTSTSTHSFIALAH